MAKMNVAVRQLSFLFILCSTIGCGQQADNSDSYPYDGSWDGSWTDSASAYNGSMHLNISENGHVSGSITNVVTSESAIITGSVDPSGNTAFYFAYPSHTDKGTGTVSITTAEHLVGTTTNYAYPGGAYTGTLSFDLLDSSDWWCSVSACY